MTFGVDPDTHIDTVEQAKASTIEGTSKWSCKLSITGTNSSQSLISEPFDKVMTFYNVKITNSHKNSQIFTFKKKLSTLIPKNSLDFLLWAYLLEALFVTKFLKISIIQNLKCAKILIYDEA